MIKLPQLMTFIAQCLVLRSVFLLHLIHVFVFSKECKLVLRARYFRELGVDQEGSFSLVGDLLLLWLDLYLLIDRLQLRGRVTFWLEEDAV